MSGPQQVAIRLQDGTSLRVPRQWTDADGAQLRRDRQKEDDFFFTLDSLRMVIGLLEAFMKR